MTIKKCRECGGDYKVEPTKISLIVNHKDIEAIEDIFFCEVTDEHYKKLRPRIRKFWKQLCEQEEKHKL